MSRNCYATQGRLLISALKRKPHTYMEMLRHGISTSPWKRVLECIDSEREVLIRAVGDDGLVRWRVYGKKSLRVVGVV